MQVRFGMRHVLAAHMLGTSVLGAIVSCGSSNSITPVATPQSGVTCGPSGMIVPVEVHAGSSNTNVAFAGEPATISVNPATSLTDKNGDATSYALVPYGTQGVVVASAIGDTTGGVLVPAVVSPVKFTMVSLTPDTSVTGANAEVGSVGQIYAATIQVAPPSQCVGTGALIDLPVTFSVVQASSASGGPASATSGSSGSSGSSSSGSSSASSSAAAPGSTLVYTDMNGQASAKILVPWGGSALLQVSGGAQVKWFAIDDNLANPATISCLQWSQQSAPETNVYQVTAAVTYSANNMTGPLPGFPVTFSIASPIASATATGAPATVAPMSAITSQAGEATAFVTLEQTAGAPTTPPVVVEAVAGSSASTVAIGSAASGSFPSGCATP
jgi:hypothetical protein